MGSTEQSAVSCDTRGVPVLSLLHSILQLSSSVRTGAMSLQYEEEVNFLHGTLKIHVIEARDLPDTDSSFFHISRGDWTDPYVQISLDNTELCKTAYLKNNLDPVWDEKFSVDVCHHASCLQVKVM